VRALASIGLALAGLTTSGAAYVQSNGPVRPASPWSLSERLLALRIDRSLPRGARKLATLTVRGRDAVFKVREATGPVLLKCPLRAGVDVAQAFALYAAGDPSPCESQAVDEVGDVLVYEVNGRTSPLCPGQFATQTEQQLHNALFLPAARLLPMGWAPAGVLKPGKLDACGAGQGSCALFKAAGAVLYCGELESCASGACFQGQRADIRPDDVAASLYYYQALAQAKVPSQVAPAACGAVPMSVHLSTLVSEAVTATTADRFAEAAPWNASTLPSPSSVETAADVRAYFGQRPRGICFFVRGIDVDRPRDAEMVAQGLAFPVFAPFDPRAAGRASPLLRALQAASAPGQGSEAMEALFGRCDLASAVACRQHRERIASQLRSALLGLGPALTNLAADEIPYHVGASGPFHLVDFDSLHVLLESTAEVAKAKGARARLTIGYQPLWPESVAEKRQQCAQQPGICLFRALWDPRAAAPAVRGGGKLRPSEGESEDGFESLVGLFGRRDSNTRCLRRLFDALAAAGEDRLLELQRELREPVGAGENRAPCDARARAQAGLVPREGHAQTGCPAPGDQLPFGGAAGEPCRALSLVFVQEEPWAGAAARIAAIAGNKGVAVSVSGIKASEVHRGSLGSWDVLLTVASNYYNRKYPTLVPLLHPSGNQNLSGGQAISEAPGRQLLTAYESSIVYPPPAWLGAPAAGEPPSRADSLRQLEDDVARHGPAPIYPLAFLRPATLAIPESQADASAGSWYFARLLQAWSAQP
jgi:hypothetical protein